MDTDTSQMTADEFKKHVRNTPMTDEEQRAVVRAFKAQTPLYSKAESSETAAAMIAYLDTHGLKLTVGNLQRAWDAVSHNVPVDTGYNEQEIRRMSAEEYRKEVLGKR